MLKIPAALLAEGINGYSDAAQAKKDAFHRAGKKFFRDLASAIGLQKGSFDVRSNLGGIAVSGEVTLHGESIYVQLSESCMHRGCSILYRTCRGRKDFTGGQNRWLRASDMHNTENVERFVRECQQMTEESYA